LPGWHAVVAVAAEERAKKKAKKKAELKDIGETSVSKLRRSSGDVAKSKLTIAEMQSIALRYFDGKELSGKKANIVVALTSLLSTKPALLDAPEEDDAVAMEVEGQDDPTNISDIAVTNAEA
jgi:hypothetical protein